LKRAEKMVWTCKVDTILTRIQRTQQLKRIHIFNLAMKGADPPPTKEMLTWHHKNGFVNEGRTATTLKFLFNCLDEPRSLRKTLLVLLVSSIFLEPLSTAFVWRFF